MYTYALQSGSSPMHEVLSCIAVSDDPLRAWVGPSNHRLISHHLLIIHPTTSPLKIILSSERANIKAGINLTKEESFITVPVRFF